MSADKARKESPVSAVVSRKEIARALEAEQFVLHFQPVVELSTGQPTGTEALIRWDHPEAGLLAPDSFLPAVAQTQVMPALTRWVMHAACTAAARWPDWTVSVNVTARDLASGTLIEHVLGALDATGVPADRLVLELTETALVHDLTRAADALGELRARGVGVALDDFGTGYSSMLYLRELPVSSVKIDRVFMPGLQAGSDDLAIVTSLLTLARTVGLTAVAEGVETEAQVELLDSLGCRFGQGFLWSRPVPSDDADALYRDGLPNAARAPGPGRRQRPRHPAEARVAQRARDLMSRGASLNTIAAALNAAGERTDRGSRWHAVSVARLINSSLPPT
jgi:EAL domain-containing protein (putative c-di-GMP-specific phosphodiesterase class I)